MNGQLQAGTTLVSDTGVSYNVVSLLGAGGQGEVYEVESSGTRKALKWYFQKNAIPQQRDILNRLIEIGSPDATFLWPEDMIYAPDGKTFGYIMPLRPKRFRSMPDLMKCRVNPSFYVLCRTAYNLAKEYEKLHAMGNCYRDISLGNLFFDPNTGDIQICDNDNVAPKDMEGLVKGTYGFMAPEIMRREAKPSRYTDQYSLAVLLFHLFMVAHPLHGKQEASIKCWDVPAQDLLYGTRPLFIFDPDDAGNRPVKGIHDNALIYWPVYPQELRDLFTESFTTGLHFPHKRVTEKRWMDAIANMMSGICICPKCGAEVFYDDAKSAANAAHICWNCSSPVKMPPVLAVGKRRVLLQRNATIPVHQIYGGGDMETAAGTVVQNPKNPALLGIRNDTRENWIYIRPDGAQVPIAPGRSAAIVKNVKIDFGYNTGEIR